MRNLRKLALLAVGLGVSSVALAEWESAELETMFDTSGRNPNGDYVTCDYKTGGLVGGGYRFSVTMKGSCELYIEVDPESGKWRRR
ncbi:hypothetical protein [Lonepinella sp. BR2357]|uniref:hypothetical protein n=1 Tax=Lonepinella sp. BR2357 TaxID=3434549 RepID=UPI003F6DEBB0